jgi:hypothetical protein
MQCMCIIICIYSDCREWTLEKLYQHLTRKGSRVTNPNELIVPAAHTRRQLALAVLYENIF